MLTVPQRTLQFSSLFLQRDSSPFTPGTLSYYAINHDKRKESSNKLKKASVKQRISQAVTTGEWQSNDFLKGSIRKVG